MGICCNLQVDVNGEEVFFVDKKIVASFSGKLSKLFGKMVGTSSYLKVIFQDFPGGAEGFELVVRFCYNNGKIEITPSNVILLHCAANFMEMKKESSTKPDLIDQTEKYFEGIQCWTWSELLICLKQCQDLSEVTNSSSILQKFLDLFAERLALLNITSPYSSSSENSNSHKLSCDTSSESAKSYLSQSTWWFEDLVFLNINLFEKVIKTMVSQKFDPSTICLFLFYYQRSKFLGATPSKKGKIIEAVINLLFLLDRNSISSRGLFNAFRLALCLKTSKLSKKKLEFLVGSKLDQATIDDLLIPSPRGKKYMYDVNLILRLMKSFFAENQFSPHRLKKVVRLMELYLAEVAPDPHLKPSKFVALATELPELARDSHDRIYPAIDIYLKVHGSLCHAEKMKVCSILKHKTLSMEASIDLAKSYTFRPGTVHGDRSSHQSKFRSFIHQDSKLIKTLSYDSPLCYTGLECS